ncbi:MAG: hypothetical protein AOA65_1564 [Candidatus Bathyarchaeota archaeon BA1]|nr:MAG: hypothetical protein AOA65_1564 [Candidatus Bathyarchaeota archaeon BA1]
MGIDMGDMVSITIKLPRELRENMRRLGINWSEYLREAILRRIEEDGIKKASATLDEVRMRAKTTPTSDIVTWIREDRGR